MKQQSAGPRLRKLMSRLLAGGLLALALGAAAPAQAPSRHVRDIEMRTLEHDGARRTFGLYVPSAYDPARPAPLIIALHGRHSSPKALHALGGLARTAEARGAVLVYPQAAGEFWNDGGHATLKRRETPADDDGFLEAAVAAVEAEYAVDRRRLYLVGQDTGGVMAFRLACRGPLPIAGAAVVGALMWDFSAAACGDGARPTPMLIVHGRQDATYPVRGARPRGAAGARRLGVDDTLAAWRAVNGCTGRPAGRDDSVFHRDCSSGSGLAYVGVARGANAWFRDAEAYGLNRHGIDAAALIDRFFFEPASFALPDARGSGPRGRGFITYVPAGYDPAKPAPVVVVLHGRPSNAAAMASISNMNAVADRHGFIVVYPEGLDNEWNAFFDLVGQRSIAPQDDVAFLRRLMDDLAVDLSIDRRRLYVAGFSNGGFMTHRMMCSASDRFAAFASVGAALYTVLSDECRGGPPAPILVMHGTADPSIPYRGVEVENPDGQRTRVTLGVQETVALFMRRNHCSEAGSSTTFAEKGRSPGTHVIRFTPRDCDPGAPVVFYLINGGGHTWPGVPDVLDEATFGPTNLDIDASEAIWTFFAGQSLAEPAR